MKTMAELSICKIGNVAARDEKCDKFHERHFRVRKYVLLDVRPRTAL
jgi:hypothetical protein